MTKNYNYIMNMRFTKFKDMIVRVLLNIKHDMSCIVYKYVKDMPVN